MAAVVPMLASGAFQAGLAGIPGAFTVSNVLSGVGGSLVSGLATAGSLLGTFQTGRMEEAQQKATARAALINEQVAAGQTQALLERQQRGKALRMGAIRASGMSAIGDILESSAAQEELDLLTIKSEGALKKMQYAGEAKQAIGAIPKIRMATLGKGASTLLSSGAF